MHLVKGKVAMSVYDTMTAGLTGAGLVLLGFVTTHGSSEYHLNASQMQATLQANAEAALRNAGLDWAKVSFNGQRATVSGTAPRAEIATQAAELVLTSSGKGGWIYGGVISVANEIRIEAVAAEALTLTPDTGQQAELEVDPPADTEAAPAVETTGDGETEQNVQERSE